MTEPEFSVFPAGVLRAVEDMLQIGAVMQSEFRALSSDGDAVITGSWTGPAANAIAAVWQPWEADFGKHLAQVEHAPEVLATAAREFENLDSTGGS